MSDLGLAEIKEAHNRIVDFVVNTPIVQNTNLNQKFSAQFFFKLENQQHTKSFKLRGAVNAILEYKEKNGHLPLKIVAQSSGNHAQAVAYICKKLGIEAMIFMAKNTSPIKIKSTKDFGATVILCEKRSEANRLAEEKSGEGYFFIHPSGNNSVICGQGTACLEALMKIGEVDAIFAPCGGGGLIGGCMIAAKGISSRIKVFGCEPANANDAAISVRENKIHHFTESPNTIADGARTLAVTELCFHYLKKLDGILEISEKEIEDSQKELIKTFDQAIEPTSALAFAGAIKFLKENNNIPNPRLLIIVSGGNI